MTARLAPTHDIKPEDERPGRESSRKDGKFSDCQCFTYRRGKKWTRERKKSAATQGEKERDTERETESEMQRAMKITQYKQGKGCNSHGTFFRDNLNLAPFCDDESSCWLTDK